MISEIINSALVCIALVWLIYLTARISGIEDKQKSDYRYFDNRCDNIRNYTFRLSDDLRERIKECQCEHKKPCEDGKQKEPELEMAEKVSPLEMIKKLNKWCNENGYVLKVCASDDGKGYDVAIFKKAFGFNYMMCRAYLEDDYEEALDVRYQEIICAVLNGVTQGYEETMEEQHEKGLAYKD